MSAVYPGAKLVATAALLDNNLLLSEWQQIVYEVEAVENALGLNPHVSSVTGLTHADVGTRIAALETQLSIFGRLGYKNIVITNGATPNSILAAQADYVAVEGVLVANLNDTANITAANGAGGLDTGSVAVNTWYHLYVIHDPSSTTTKLIFSTSAVRPSMPAGYTNARRIGAVRTDSSGNFLRFSQADNVAVYNGDDQNGNLRVLVAGKQTSTFANVSVLGCVPPTAHVAALHVIGYAAGGRTCTAYILAGGVTAGTGQNGLIAINGTTGDVRNSGVLVRLSGNNFQYKFAGTATGGSEGIFIEVQGYFDAI